MTEHSGLAEALAAFQGEDGLTFAKTKTAKVKSQRTGGEYTYKYADLGDILPVVRPLLAKHGLSWSSKPGSSESGDLILFFRLLHAGGEVDAGEMPLGVDKNCRPQELGSAITYARRYALTAQLNLATEEDDDAQAAQGASGKGKATNGTSASTVAQPQAKPPEQGPKPASAKQRGLMNVRAAEKHLSSSQFADVVKTVFGLPITEWSSQEDAQNWLQRQLDRLPASKVDAVLDGIASAPEQLALSE